MAELSYQERMQPSLLDRLTDDDPDKTKESRTKRVLSVRQLRATVLRDLAWLLNTSNLESAVDLTDHPAVGSSVVNYGVPEFTGLTSASVEAEDLERDVKQAVVNFEPRIRAETLEVRVIPNEETTHSNCIAFEIKGELWARPIPLELFLMTEVDLETGSMATVDAGG